MNARDPDASRSFFSNPTRLLRTRVGMLLCDFDPELWGDAIRWLVSSRRAVRCLRDLGDTIITRNWFARLE